MLKAPCPVKKIPGKRTHFVDSLYVNLFLQHLIGGFLASEMLHNHTYSALLDEEDKLRSL